MERARLNTPLRQALDADGRRQTWLAEQVGVDPRQVWAWVHGLVVPLPANRAAIALALGRTVEDLFPAHNADSATTSAVPTDPIGDVAA